MARSKPKSLREPRDISDTVWYYVHRGSVTLVAEVHRDSASGEYVATAQTRLTRKVLQAMLAEMPKPGKKR